MKAQPDRDLEHLLRDQLRSAQADNSRVEQLVLAVIGDRTPNQLVREDRVRDLLRATMIGSCLWLALSGILVWIESRSAVPASGLEPEEAMSGLYRWMDELPPSAEEPAAEANALAHVLVGERSP